MRRSNDTKKKAKSMERQHPHAPPPGKRLYLGYTTTSSGGERESDEPYSSRSPQYIEVKFTSLTRQSGTFFAHDIEVSDEVHAADEVFLVVVRYQDGDSFGTSHGNWTVFKAVTSEAEATEIAGSIEDGSLAKAVEADQKRGVYNTCLQWVGYFNSLEGVEIHSFRVAEKPFSDNVSPKVSIHRH